MREEKSGDTGKVSPLGVCLTQLGLEVFRTDWAVRGRGWECKLSPGVSFRALRFLYLRRLLRIRGRLFQLTVKKAEHSLQSTF